MVNIVVQATAYFWQNDGDRPEKEEEPQDDEHTADEQQAHRVEQDKPNRGRGERAHHAIRKPKVVDVVAPRADPLQHVRHDVVTQVGKRVLPRGLPVQVEDLEKHGARRSVTRTP